MIDQNRDGFIDKEDLHDMLASLGRPNMTVDTCLNSDVKTALFLLVKKNEAVTVETHFTLMPLN